jgi:hypothetical protein
MFTFSKRTIATAAVIAAAIAPSTASAKFLQADPAAPAGGSAPAEITPSVTPAVASSPQGFHWDDAGIGAGGVVVLLGAGVGSGMLISRRRAGQARVG